MKVYGPTNLDALCLECGHRAGRHYSFPYESHHCSAVVGEVGAETWCECRGEVLDEVDYALLVISGEFQ